MSPAPNSKPGPQSARLAFADGIRGLAALWVVLFHASEGGHLDRLKAVLPAVVSTALFDWGHLGVAVFFVLSGFVMAHSVRKYPFTPAFGGRFMLRRLLRLTPPYYASIVFVIAYVSGKALVQGQHLPLPRPAVLAAHAAYLQDILSLDTLSVVYWTLCIEIQFYIAFVALMLASHWVASKPGMGAAARLLTMASALIGLPWAFGWLTAPIYTGGFLSFWYCFMLGALVSDQAHDQGMRAFFWLYVVALAASGMRAGSGVTGAALAATGLIYFGGRFDVLARILSVRALQFLGLVSYSLYLTHNQTTGATAFVLKRLAGASAMNELALLAVIVMTSLVVAWIGYSLVERPSTALSRKVSLGASTAIRF
jgi:peptidoglycan/LPS O-acetylase OafA/YrhL